MDSVQDKATAVPADSSLPSSSCTQEDGESIDHQFGAADGDQDTNASRDSTDNSAASDTASSDSTEEMLAEATAAAVRAATYERSDSILSLDIENSSQDEGTRAPQNASINDKRHASFRYMQEASMEIAVAHDTETHRISPNGPLGHRRASLFTGSLPDLNMEGESVESMSDDTGEMGTFQDGPIRTPDKEEPKLVDESPAEEDNTEDVPVMTRTSDVLKACGVVPLSLEELARIYRVSEEAARETLLQSHEEGNPNLDNEVLLLGSLFANFCSPPPSLESIGKILDVERSMSSSGLSGWKERAVQRFDKSQSGSEASSPTVPLPDVPLPQDVVVSMSGVEKRFVISLLCNQPEKHLLRLNTPFQMAFFRILIRLLTNETDAEYNRECLLVCDWWEDQEREDAPKQFAAARLEDSNADTGSKNKTTDSTTDQQNSSSSRPPRNGDSKKAWEEKRKHRRKAQQNGRLKRNLTATKRTVSIQSPHQIYTIVRFRNGAAWSQATSSDGKTVVSKSDVFSNLSSNLNLGQGSAVTVLLRLLEQLLEKKVTSTFVPKAQYPYDHLIAPVVRLLGLSCAAGVSVKELRGIMTLAGRPLRGNGRTSVEKEQLDPENTGPNFCVPAFARLLLVRALSTAAEGASQSTVPVGKASPRHFFTFGRGKGLVRNMKSLSTWPFKNDFGMAVWFRAESFIDTKADSDARHPTLLSIRTEDGGGIEVSLLPPDETSSNDLSNVAVLAVTVRDSDSPDGCRRVVLKGCVLLPQVWYHVSVRHTRARLQGVFSLSTRQQISIMLDGKVMLTDELEFPEIRDSFQVSGNSSKFLSPSLLRSRKSSNDASLNVTATFGSDFDGQTGALYVFNDHVSEATLRALSKATAGKGELVKQESLSDEVSMTLSRRVSGYEVEMTQADAKEVVVTRQESGSREGSHHGAFRSISSSKVLDLADGETHEDAEVPPELSKAAFSSKLFLAWDPKRTEGSVALELHSGAHVHMDMDRIQPWYIDGAKDVIASIGGIQAILPLFHLILSGDVERRWGDNTSGEAGDDFEHTFDEAILYTMIPSLLSLLASFVRNHCENTREALRCGGVDVVEQAFLQNKTIGSSRIQSQKHTLMSVLRFYPGLSNRLVDSLLDLRLASWHDLGLETKVLSRLLFNVPLWLGGVDKDPGVALHATLLPVLSDIARSSPHLRNCVCVREMIESLSEYTNVGETPLSTDDIAQNIHESSTVLFDRSCRSGLKDTTPLTIHERRHVIDITLGIVLTVIARGAIASHLSSLLSYISYNLDTDWEEHSIDKKAEEGEAERKGSRLEKYLATYKACLVLLFLLQGRPVVPSLFESLAECCGGTNGFASWILCALVNSVDDSTRSIGVRCLNAYLDVAAPAAELFLSASASADTTETLSSKAHDASKGDISPQVHKKAVQMLSATMTNVGKGLAVIGNSGMLSGILPPFKLNVNVVYKLLWHLLKCHRARIGEKTQSAVVNLLLDDRVMLSLSIGYFVDGFVSPNDVLQIGYKANIEWADAFLAQTRSIASQQLRDTPAISTVLRLLRFLPEDMKERWLSHFQALVTQSRSNLNVLAASPDWQPCLFLLISEIVEEMNAEQTANKGGPDHLHLGMANSDVAITDHPVPRHESSGFTEYQDGVTAAAKLKTKDPTHNRNDNNGNTGMTHRRIGEMAIDSTDGEGTLSRTHTRFDHALKLYATLLGHCIRHGGDKAFQAVETAASLQRVCVNGEEVFSLILSHLLADLVENGTILNVESFAEHNGGPKEDRMTPLKKSAGIVTKAILSNGTDGMDMATAVRHWRCLRHLTAVVVAVITKSGFGVDELFDYRNQHASALDSFTGGLHGIRLPDGSVPGITAATCKYLAASKTKGSGDSSNRNQRDNCRRVCVTLAAQLLLFLDAFIFPDSLDASLPASQLHGLALVRSTESRLGLAQGPLLASLVRLSLLLLCHLEPSSVKFLQCCSRLRCFLHWTLELIRESVALAGYSAAFHDLTAPLDRLVLAVVLHSHRALSRCSAVLFEIEASSFEAYFPSEDVQKKSYRRLFRVVFELREMVLAAYRGRNEVLRAALSLQAFDALQGSLEKTPSDQSLGDREIGGAISREAIIRLFLSSAWVTGFHDIDMHGSFAVPEQVANGQVHGHRTASHRGLLAMEEIALESSAIVEDFNKGLDASFEAYCQRQRQWAETDAVRDLEYEGDTTVKRLSGKHRTDLSDTKRAASLRLEAMKVRWDDIERQVSELWGLQAHWKLADYTDRLSRRILLDRNRHFNDHNDASYELMLGQEREKADRERKERLQRQQEEELSAVVRRNEAAFVPYGETETEEIEEELDDANFDHITSTDSEQSTGENVERVDESIALTTDGTMDDDWDELGTEEVAAAKENIDSDAWAKAFIWSDSESIVARFEEVFVVTLQSLTEGNILITTHGLYFHPTADETNVMTKETVARPASDRRWRLSRVTEVHGRRYMLRPQALEVFFSDTHELFLNFSHGARERDRFYAKLRNSCKVPMLWSPKSLNPRTRFRGSKVTDLWKKRKISNFQYLMHLNFMAGRSFNDISQYPVFPWVLTDYTSEKLDLSDSRVFRDLSKPVGALNPDRLAQLIERYHDLENFGFPEQEKFLYGSHYSSPGMVLHYLVRQEPFTTMAIALQSGRFDCPDRLFFDLASCWNSCMTSTSDVKELIPEFFTCPEILLNTNNYPLGATQNNRVIHDVGLPPWANGSAYEFVRMHRLALESDYVSQNLNHWIDLIFGYKQRGPEAAAAHNIFHYLSYEGSVDLDKITDEVDRIATESHIQNFGQTPCQLLAKDPHPTRYAAAECWEPLIDDVLVPKQLRCHIPPRQCGGKRHGHGHARGAVLSIHVMTDTVVAVYADLSVGTYKWSPARSGGGLKLDKHRTLSRSELSTSRSAMKRGSTAPQSMESSGSHLAVGNWSFALTPGGIAKETFRRRTAMSRLNPSKDMASMEGSSLLISCGYWDNTVKVHSIDGLKLRCSETGGHRGPILCLDVGNDGALMITGGQDATCRVWVVDHPDMAIALSDGYMKTALGESNGKKEQLLTCCHVLWGHQTAITCLSLSSELDVTVSGSIRGTICIHTIRRGTFIRSILPAALSGCASEDGRSVRKLALDSNGTFVAHMEDCGLHAYTVNGVLLCSANTGEILHDMKFCSGGKVLVTGGNDGHVVLRTTHDLQIKSTLDLSRHGPVRCLSFTPEDLNPIPQFLFIGNDDGIITIVDKDTKSVEKASAKHPQREH